MTHNRLLVVSAVMLGVIGLSAPPGAAAPTNLTPPSWMLAPDDVPAALGKPKPGKSNYIVEGAPAVFTLCVPATGSPAITVQGAAGWQTTVVLKGKVSSEVSEQQNFFPIASSAVSTFADLQDAASECNGTSTSPISDDPSNPINGTCTNTNTTGTTGTGIWVNVSTKAKSRDPKINGTVTNTYTVYRLNDNDIAATSFSVSGASKITAAQRAAVNALSTQLTAM